MWQGSVLGLLRGAVPPSRFDLPWLDAPHAPDPFLKPDFLEEEPQAALAVATPC